MTGMQQILPRLTPALLAGACVLAGCAQENPPYTDQTAAIDPALQTDTPAPELAPTPADPTPDPAQTMTDDTQPPAGAPADTPIADGDGGKVELTDAQWRAVLSEKEYAILRHSATEYAFTGRYLDNELPGAYHCVGCGNKLYDARHKFHSGCGWPSFFQEIEDGSITEYRDTSHGMVRVEMRCARCNGHLGHIFNDAPDQPTGLRHCVNGYALIFVPEGAAPRDVIRKHREANADQ